MQHMLQLLLNPMRCVCLLILTKYFPLNLYIQKLIRLAFLNHKLMTAHVCIMSFVFCCFLVQINFELINSLLD